MEDRQLKARHLECKKSQSALKKFLIENPQPNGSAPTKLKDVPLQCKRIARDFRVAVVDSGEEAFRVEIDYGAENHGSKKHTSMILYGLLSKVLKKYYNEFNTERYRLVAERTRLTEEARLSGGRTRRNNNA